MTIETKLYQYRVPYIEGTDNLITQCNLMLDKIVDRIVTDNDSVNLLHRYVYGSEEFEGFPIWNSKPEGSVGNWTGSTIEYNDFSNITAHPEFVSDIITLGKSNENVCFSLFFRKVRTDGLFLIICMTPGYDQTTLNNILETKPAKSVGSNYIEIAPITCAIRPYFGQSTSSYENDTSCLALCLKCNPENNEIFIELQTYQSDNSNGYSFKTLYKHFINTRGYDLIITKDECVILHGRTQPFNEIIGTNLSIYRKQDACPKCFSLNERLSNDPSRILWRNVENGISEDCSRVSIDCWGNIGLLTNSSISNNFSIFQANHVLGLYMYYSKKSTNYGFNTSENVSCLEFASDSYSSNKINTDTMNPYSSILQIPRLGEGQSFLRKLYVPGTNFKSDNIVLLLVPSSIHPNPNTIYNINGVKYLGISPSQLTIAVKLE